jgi:hypothetical protein
MNESPQTERLRTVATAYAQSIEVPEYDATAVQARLARARPARPPWRTAAIAAAAAALVIVLVAGAPAVLAEVERMMQAFAVIGGQNVKADVSQVSLDAARRDMPFAVVAPAAIPPGYTGTVDELNFGTSPLDSRVVFQYRSQDPRAPALTIIESSATSTASHTRLWMTQGVNGMPRVAPPPLPSAASGQHAFMQFHRNGQVFWRARIEPMTWVVRGTRIDLISPPGLLTGPQLAAIRRAMSR